MNNFVLIAMVAVGFISQGEAQDPFGVITTLKNKVKSAVSDIRMYCSSHRSPTYDLKRLKFDAFKPYDDGFLKIRFEIDKHVTAAKKDGLDASRCFKSMKTKFQDLQNSILEEMDSCIENALVSVNAVEDKIDEYIRQGSSLCSQLDSIAGRCMSFNSLQTQTCVILALASSSNDVNSFVPYGKKLEEKRTSSHRSAYSSVSMCLHRINSIEIFNKTRAIRSEAIECIESITGSELQSRDEF